MNLDFLKQKPSKIVAVGLNYRDHAEELSIKVPEEPLLFLKPVSSLIGPDDEIVLPEMSQRVDYEAELAIAIKNKIKNIEPEQVMDNILGFTCLNDVTARDLQKKDSQWARAKGFDTFCPVGPKIVKLDNPNNVDIELRLNGEVKQKSNTKNFVFPVEKLVSFISKIMTLEQGDIITTGTSSGIGAMKSGDVVEVEIEGIGVLRNKVV